MSTAAQRSLAARKAVYARLAAEDPKEMIAPARRGFMARFDRQVDPDGTLDPAERARRADAAMRSYMAGLGLSSVRARQRSKARRSA